YDAVTLREIARKAEVDLALPNYYFGRKPALFETVFKRRAKLINDWRLAALDDAIAAAAPAPPSLRAIMEAYLKPILTGPHITQPGWREYYALVAYVNNSTVWGGKLMSNFFDPMVARFLEALHQALPDAEEGQLYWSYQCLSGALTLAFAQTGRIDRLSDGACISTDLPAAYESMVEFCTAGFAAACGPRPQ
ncbi:MAG: TetR/AcrR family transcriptional regulator, partial [Cellvibrionaceae bacterium]|nr:TetR/AcrR family transcriptional regulator [Cellvibrionaceae bacterium]